MIHVERWPVDLAPVLVLVASAAVSAALIKLLFPVLIRYALARPNARSSHRQPTPQGGGMAVIAATILVMLVAGALAIRPFDDIVALGAIGAATLGLAIVGALDDLRPMAAIPRLVLQALAVAVVLWALPDGARIVTAMPLTLERGLIFIGLLWWVNAVNFMDGIDWITVAEIVPVTAALGLLGLTGLLPREAMLAAFALCGALIGFAPFNKPTAKLFIGDVGSLPIGLVTGWLLVLLASTEHLAAAVLLPLYYIADATITLVKRTLRGEPILQAHRSHYYQQAFDGGMPALRIVAQVFMLNIALAILAAATFLTSSPLVHLLALGVGCALVGRLLYRFAAAKA